MALSMPCAFCAAKLTLVITATWDEHHKTIRRFRLCPSCDYRWSTLEIDFDQVLYLESVSAKSQLQAGPQRPRKKKAPRRRSR